MIVNTLPATNLITQSQEIAKNEFIVGDRAQIVYLPSKNGAEIKIPALVREVLRDGYRVDTDFQGGIKVKVKDLIQVQELI